MSPLVLRRLLQLYLLLLVPVAWAAMLYDRYIIDGDAVAYMDIADLLRTHHWAGAVNAYWHPLYPVLLSMAQALLHPSRSTELGAYYTVNFFLFFAQAAAMLAFTSALCTLRAAPQEGGVGAELQPRHQQPQKKRGFSPGRSEGRSFSLPTPALKLLGLALLVIAMQRELSLGRVRPDGLLQALILAALAMLLRSLASESFVFAPLMGFFLGLAYLTKSFAFLLAVLSIAALILFQWLVQKRAPRKVLANGALAFLVFTLIAGPYVAALSKQKGRFDFGDSGNLNYAWYVGGTEKMHLEPWMTNSFGSATVTLKHPEQQLQISPGIYSYKSLPLGTYPAWFDSSFFNERIVPHVRLGDLARHDVHTFVQVMRYLLNHPEPLLLLALLLALGARPHLRRSHFWIAPVALGLAMWGLYGMVNVEERYVTVAYLAVLLPLFAALRPREETTAPHTTAIALIGLFAFLALGESARLSAESRRNESVEGLPHAWYKPSTFEAAAGLRSLGIQPEDEVACIGTMACLNDNYWARLAGVRILTEIYAPDPTHLIAQLDAMPNREQSYNILRDQGARVLVGIFDPGEMTSAHPAAAGWQRLGVTNYYALPLFVPLSRNPRK